jgi:hypothetical protein
VQLPDSPVFLDTPYRTHHAFSGYRMQLPAKSLTLDKLQRVSFLATDAATKGKI